jgi:hypothetical protein
MGGAIMGTAPAVEVMRRTMYLVGTIKYGLVFCALILIVPLSAIEGLPMHGVTGNLFVDLNGWGVFWASMFLVAVSWSVMLTEGLIVNGAAAPRNTGAKGYRSFRSLAKTPGDRLPTWAEAFFSVPITAPQLAFFTALAVPGLVLMVRHSTAAHAWPAAVAGILGAYVVMLLLCLPAALSAPDDPPLRDPIARWVWEALKGGRLGRAAGRLTEIAARPADALGLQFLVDDVAGEGGRKRLFPAHVFALTTTILLAVLCVVLAVVFFPERPSARFIAPVVFLWVSAMLFIWVFGALNFHLRRFHVSPLLVVVGVIVLGYGWTDTDHWYKVHPAPPRTAAALTPVDVAAGGRPRNLVVVASAGGGISAGVWTTVALEQMVSARPTLAREIRVLSTISGGSVGGAFYIDGLRRDARYMGTGTLTPSTLSTIREKSAVSSLSAVAYGLAFRDLTRLLTGGVYTPHRDRGDLLERDWERIAAGDVGGTVARGPVDEDHPLLLSDMSDAIRLGRIPAPLFGATVMETGRRVMITPVDFGDPAPWRGRTLREFLAAPATDVTLWTAARLSATFAFVSPASRAELKEGKDYKPMDTGGGRLHLIDGGYYDNFGVTSAVDWLRSVLEVRAAELDPRLTFTRVALVELRAFRREDVVKTKPAAGYAAAMFGPMLGLAAIRDGSAAERDDIDVARFVETWNNRFKQAREPICLGHFVFEPGPSEPPPLSWQLSREETRRIQASWSGQGAIGDPARWTGSIRERWSELEGFLNGACGKGRP